MAEISEQRLGYGFGLLGGLLIGLAGVVSFAFGVADLVVGRPFGAMNALSETVVLFVVGGLSAFFAWLGHRDWSARPLASGVMLVVMAFLGWLVVGVGANLLALLGSLFVFLAGVLYLLEPAKKATRAIVSAS